MTSVERKLLLWSPRVLGAVVAMYVGLFALDAVSEGLSSLLLHLGPSLLVALVVVVSWKREWVGGVTFVALAALYAVTAAQRPDWILAISGPLLLVGLLFLWSWRFHRELHEPDPAPSMP